MQYRDMIISPRWPIIFPRRWIIPPQRLIVWSLLYIWYIWTSFIRYKAAAADAIHRGWNVPTYFIINDNGLISYIFPYSWALLHWHWGNVCPSLVKQSFTIQIRKKLNESLLLNVTLPTHYMIELQISLFLLQCILVTLYLRLNDLTCKPAK